MWGPVSYKGFRALKIWLIDSEILVCKINIDFQRLTMEVKMQVSSLIVVIDFMFT